jgi:addiction module RelE/StbE family toxin
MIVLFHRHFRKQYRKQSAKIKQRFKERLRLFIDDKFHPILEDHALGGEWKSFRSINITGDVRVIYQPIDADTVEFTIIGTHSELYGK